MLSVTANLHPSLSRQLRKNNESFETFEIINNSFISTFIAQKIITHKILTSCVSTIFKSTFSAPVSISQ